MTENKIDISGTYFIKALLIVGGILLFMFFGAGLIMPLVVAAIIATLLDKPTKKLTKWGLPRWLSMVLSLIMMILTFLLLTWLISSQLNLMAEDWSTIKEKATEKLNGTTEWANKNLNWEYKDYIENNQKLVAKIEGFVGVFATSIVDLLSQSLIIFVYIILFLIQKNIFIKFFKKLSSNKAAMSTILHNASKVISSYLLGKSKIMLFLFGIYYLGFTLGSVPYALFLAVFGALFSIIPYVGNIIGGGIAVILSFLYAGSTSALIVIGVITLAQIVENYILTPLIIGDETDLNPFITVFGILLFSMLWAQ